MSRSVYVVDAGLSATIDEPKSIAIFDRRREMLVSWIEGIIPAGKSNIEINPNSASITLTAYDATVPTIGGTEFTFATAYSSIVSYNPTITTS